MKLNRLIASFLFASSLLARESIVIWTNNDSISSPESTYFDVKTNSLYVSSIDGEGTNKDASGWISKIAPNGKTISTKWVKGLNAPKGMRSYADYLYVSDIDQVVKINLKTAKIEKKIDIKDAKFLNDIAVDSVGRVFVSDTLTSTIHVLENDIPKVFVTGKEWESPNGLLVQENYLIVAAWGYIKSFSEKASGHLYKINLKTKKKVLISSKKLGNLDGLEVDPSNPDRYFLSDWMTGEIFSIKNGIKEGFSVNLNQGSADFGLYSSKDSNSLTLTVPQMNESKVFAFKVKQ